MPNTATAPAYELVARSALILGEAPNKGVTAIAAPNPNQMNRIVGQLPDGKRVIVAQRPGRGGMDFAKLMGGKVFAVAADALSPVYEKGEDKKPTKVQKTEDGLPLYSASGFYLMSSREYPALSLPECYARLINKGEQALLLAYDAVSNCKSVTLMGLDSAPDLEAGILGVLDDSHNLVAQFDEATNKKRQRAIARAREDADADGQAYEGVAFKEVSVSKKDGNPFCLVAWVSESGKSGRFYVLREAETENDEGHPVTAYFTADEAVAAMLDRSPGYAELRGELEAGRFVQVNMAQGHVMRTSVSFRKKVENTLALPADKPRFGDAVFVHGTLHGWCKALVSIMHSQHPSFPRADYDAHHYVAALRQAEVGMNKRADGGWQPPDAIRYRPEAELALAG